MTIKHCILSAMIILFFSCKQSEDSTKNVVVKTENYSLSVPSDLERTNHLNDLAKVQFQKVDEDLYFIVLEEPKEGFKNAIRLKIYDAPSTLYGYFQVVTDNFDDIYDEFKVDGFKTTKINSCNAIVFSMIGKDSVDGKEAFFRYAVIEDSKNLYQIMSWTNINYKDKLIKKMEGIIYSFKSNSKMNRKNTK